MEKIKFNKNKHNVVGAALIGNTTTIVDPERVYPAMQEIELLHGATNGNIIFGAKTPKWQQWSLPVDKITYLRLQNLIGLNLDTYISMNTFKTHRRLISNLFSLNSMWVDFDFYKIPKYKYKSCEEMVEIISQDQAIKDCPPSFWMYSGQGIYAIWLLENAHAGKCLPIWRTIMDKLHEQLEQYGADPKANEPARVLRLAGSKHSETGNVAKIYADVFEDFNPRRYSISELAKLLLPELEYTREEWLEIKKKKRLEKKQKENKRKQESKVVNIFTIHTLNYARIQDLQKLIELREGNCTGNREFILFLYRYWGNCFWNDNNKALQEILELNKMFTAPLNEEEVINATVSAEEAAEKWREVFNKYFALDEDKRPSVRSYFKSTGAYCYSNKTLIKELNITQEEMQSLITIINAEEKARRKKVSNNEFNKAKRKAKRRNENGLTSREQARLDKIYAILAYKEEGLTRKEMADKLECSVDTIKHYLKLIKKENIVKPKEEDDDVVTVVEFNDYINLRTVTQTELSLIG